MRTAARGSRSRRDAATPEPTWLTGLPAEARRLAAGVPHRLHGGAAGSPAADSARVASCRRCRSPTGGASTPDCLAELLAAPENLIVRRELVATDAGVRTALERPAQLLHDVLRDGFRVVYDPARAVFADAYAPRRPVTRRRRRSGPARVRAPFAPLAARAPGRAAGLGRRSHPSTAATICCGSSRAGTAVHPTRGVRGHRRPRLATDGSRGRAERKVAVRRAGCSPGRTAGSPPAATPASGRRGAESLSTSTTTWSRRMTSSRRTRGASRERSPVRRRRARGHPAGRSCRSLVAVPASRVGGPLPPQGRAGHVWSYFDFSVGNTSLRRTCWTARLVRRDDATPRRPGVRGAARGGRRRFGPHEDALAWHRRAPGCVRWTRADPSTRPASTSSSPGASRDSVRRCH